MSNFSGVYKIFNKLSSVGLVFVFLSSVLYLTAHIYLYVPFRYDVIKIFSPLLSIVITNILSISCLFMALFILFSPLKIYVKFIYCMLLIFSTLVMATSGYLFGIPAPVVFVDYKNRDIVLVAEQPAADYKFFFMDAPNRYFSYWTKTSNSFKIEKSSIIDNIIVNTLNDPRRVIFLAGNTNIECKSSQMTKSQMLEDCHEIKNYQ